MPFNRRAFLRRAGATAFLAATGEIRAMAAASDLAVVMSFRLRIGVLRSAGDEDFSLGLAFGLEETRHTLRLFRHDLEHDEQVDERALPHVLISSAGRSAEACELARRTGIPLLADGGGTFPGECAPWCFDLTPRTLFDGEDVLWWHPSLERFGAAQLNDRYRRRSGAGMPSAVWVGWLAAKVAGEAALRARDPERVLAILRSPEQRYDGHKGAPLYFDRQGRLVQRAFRLATSQPVQLEPVLLEVPCR
jgi:hypothetical protein